MVRSLTLVTALCLGAGVTVTAQSAPSASPHPEEAAILAVVDRFMQAVSTKDSALLTDAAARGRIHRRRTPRTVGRNPRDAARLHASPWRRRRRLSRAVLGSGRPRARQHRRCLDTVRVLDRWQDLALWRRRLRHDERAGCLEDCQHDVDGRTRGLRVAPSYGSRAHPPEAVIFSEGLRPSDSPTGSLAGAPSPRAARQAHSLPLVRAVYETACRSSLMNGAPHGRPRPASAKATAVRRSLGEGGRSRGSRRILCVTSHLRELRGLRDHRELAVGRVSPRILLPLAYRAERRYTALGNRGQP